MMGQPADPGRTNGLTARLVEPECTRESSFNEARADELLQQEPDAIAAACPYCIDILGDGLTMRQQQGRAGAQLEVTDVAEIPLRSVRQPARADTREPERQES